jgi:hypothetical protein
MKTKAILSFIVATMIALCAVSFALAQTGSLNVTFGDVSVNDVVVQEGTTILAGAAGETVPVVIKLTADSDLQDLKVKVWVEGYKSDVSASTARFDVLDGSTYIKRLSLTLPSVEDLDNTHEGLTLYVRIADKNDDKERTYQIEMQRDTYSLDLLSVEAPLKASAGDIIGLDIVLKNTGSRASDDAFVSVSIPELGVYRNAYFGDLYAQDNTSDNQDDARERRIYLAVPADAMSGDYQIQVKASNYDSTVTAKKVISITGLAAATTNSTNVINAGASNAKGEGIPTSIIVLTAVLVIIFVVLLVVLIVLLTKKPSDKVEDFGESYY